MGAFYGPNIFLAETSATSGGLDSLLEPQGPDQGSAGTWPPAPSGRNRPSSPPTAPRPATRSWCRRWSGPATSCWSTATATSRTTTAWCWPGANVVYMDSYPLHEYSMYGAVPLREIKHTLLKLKAAGKLDRVRMVLLTNCTFDGLVYNVERVMEECLAIKKDLVFLWDEAWFAFARFGPTYRQRTAMGAANNLRERLRTPEAAKAYEAQQKDAGRRRRGDLAEHPPAAAAGRAGAGLCHAIDAQDADLAAAGLDDPRQRSGLQGRGRTGLPRGLHDPHLDLAELPDHRVARRRPPAGRTGRLRVRRSARSKARWRSASAVATHSAAAEILPGPDRGRHDPRAVPRKRRRELLRRRSRAGPTSGTSGRATNSCWTRPA